MSHPDLVSAAAHTTVALQYGYNYDVRNGVTPYSASQTSQHTHKPTVKMPAGSASSLVTSAGLQPAVKAGLRGSLLWKVASGAYQYTTCNAADSPAAASPMYAVQASSTKDAKTQVG